MHVLALDFGSSCGFALGRPGIVSFSGVWSLRPVPSDSPGMRYIRLLARLNEMHRADPAISLIVMEKAHMRGAAATTYAHGYQTDRKSVV